MLIKGKRKDNVTEREYTWDRFTWDTILLKLDLLAICIFVGVIVACFEFQCSGTCPETNTWDYEFSALVVDSVSAWFSSCARIVKFLFSGNHELLHSIGEDFRLNNERWNSLLLNIISK